MWLPRTLSRVHACAGYATAHGLTAAVSSAEHLYGIMLYHHNRLIKPYFRVGVQLQPNKDGLGVLGIMEADFLQPTHNKQDFDDTKGWRKLLSSLSEKLNKYWHEETAKIEAELSTMKTQPPKRAKAKPVCVWEHNPKCTDKQTHFLHR